MKTLGALSYYLCQMKPWASILLGWLMAFGASANGYKTFEENGKVGMKDEAGHVVLPAAFDALGWSDGNFSVIGDVTGYRLHGQWGLVNLKKEFVAKANYESLVYAEGEFIVARKKINAAFTKTGCINLKGEIKIPFVYDGIHVQGLRAIVFNLENARYYFGLADLSNRLLIPLIYKNIWPLGTLRYAAENLKNKIALFGEDGKAVTDSSIDSVSVFYKSLAIVYQDHRQGLIGRDGSIKLETKYSTIKITSEGSVVAQLPNEWLLIDEKNETMKRIFADELKPINDRFIVRKGNFFGVIDREWNTVIAVEYDQLLETESGIFLAKRNTKFGVVNGNDQTVIPFVFDSLIAEQNNYRAFSKNFGWQLLDANGKILTTKFYHQIFLKNDWGFPAKSKGFSGMIDDKGREFMACVFDSIALPVQGLLAVKFKGNYGIVNTNEDWRVAPQPFPLTVINATRYVLHQPNNNFVKSLDGNSLYFSPYPLRFAQDYFIEKLPDGTEKKINYEGQIVQRTQVPENIEEIFHESEGLRGIKKNDRFGFVDQQGRLRIANRYDSIGEFHEGLAAIKLIGKWGFVNAHDQIVINPNYDGPSYFENGKAIVARNKKLGAITKNGDLILPLRYDAVQRFSENGFLLITAALCGLANEQGNVLIEPRFASLTRAGNGLLIACRDHHCGVITDNGLHIVPMIYDQLQYIALKNIFLAEKKSAWKEIKIE